jgi:hypothetical protein
MSHVHHVELQLTLVFAVLAWTYFWLRVWYMALRLLRWAYLDKKAVHAPPRRARYLDRVDVTR